MPQLIVKAVRTRRQKKLFLEFPWRLYQGDALWVPPMRRDQAGLVGYQPHPFYRRNECQTFLALRGSEVRGRIAAIQNRVHNEYHGEARGFFGFFECFDDAPVARALMDAARDWLAQQGLDRLRGPVNPGVNYSAGALVEGFDRPPSFLMPYNPPYYGRLLEDYGCRKSQDLLAFYGHRGMLADARGRLKRVLDGIVERFGIRLRHLDRKRFKTDAARFRSVLNQSLVGHWGFVPFAPEEIDELARDLSWLLVPELAVGAEIDGQLVGVAIALPDYSDRIREIDGRLFPFGFIRLLAGKRKITKYRVMAAHILPAYQRLGLGLVLMAAVVSPALGRGGQDVEFSWVAESNSLSRRPLEKFGVERIKTYRVFDLDPQPPASATTDSSEPDASAS
jgi:GNAT superfamily N-acetyltransferase